MDPDANVNELLGGTVPPSPYRARELGEALQGWLGRGGFCPSGYTYSEAMAIALRAQTCRRAREVASLRRNFKAGSK